jgi:hypothetical protein
LKGQIFCRYGVDICNGLTQRRGTPLRRENKELFLCGVASAKPYAPSVCSEWLDDVMAY